MDDLMHRVSDRRGRGRHESGTVRYERSPLDVLHMAIYLALALLLLMLSLVAERSVLGFEEDLISLVDFLNPTVERVLAGAMQWLMLVVTVGAVFVPLITRRYRVLGYVLIANCLAAVLTYGAERLVDHGQNAVVINELVARAGGDVLGVRNVYPLAQLAAMFVVLGPFVTQRWRRAGVVTIVVLVAVRLVVSYQLPSSLAFALPLGAACGAGVLFALGRPDRRPTVGAIQSALRESGLPIIEVHHAKVDARGSTPYFATMDDGAGLFVKVLGADQRAADLLFRVYRFMRLKNVGDDRPFSSLRRAVEHEALVSMMARDLGIRTPRMRGVVQVGADSMLLVYDTIAGSSLDGLPDEQISDHVMRQVWEQIAIMRRHRLAHRDLRRANVFVATDGVPWVIDFGFSELAVDDALLDADTAQMMASFVVVASPQRVVATALEVLGRDAIASSLPRLQLNALSGATQAALKQRRGLLKDLQQEVIAQAGISDVHFEPLQRLSRKSLLTLALLAAVTYFLVPQLADLPGIARQVRAANWAWLPLALGMSLFTYIGATFSLGGAVPERLPIGPMFATELGSSFAGKIAPAGLGGMALNIRFLQKQGVDEAVAVSAVGLNTIAGLVGHISLVGVFLVWAGRDAFKAFHLPDPKWFALGLGVLPKWRRAAGLSLKVNHMRSSLTV